MPDPIITSGSIFADAPGHRVQIREHWPDEWTTIEHLYCDELEFLAGPDVDRATLTWRYGVGMPAGTEVMALYARTVVVGWYVRVEIFTGATGVAGDPDNVVWVGKILEEADDRHGARVDTGVVPRRAAGEQSLLAYGLVSELDRVRLTRSIVEELSSGYVEIGRAIGFNLGQGDVDHQRLTPNRTETPLPASHLFAHSLDGAATWDARQILEYLLAWYSPGAAEDRAEDPPEVVIPFVLAGQPAAIDWIEPRLPAQDRTLRELLNTLVDRRRIASYRVEVDETTTPHQVVIRLCSLIEAPITLGSQTFPANDSQKSLDFDRAFDIELALIRDSGGHRYDQVLARGNRRGSVLTLSTADETLVRDWTLELEARYEAGASTSAGYDDLDDDAQRTRNAKARIAKSDFEPLPADETDEERAPPLDYGPPDGNLIVVCMIRSDDYAEERHPSDAAIEDAITAGELSAVRRLLIDVPDCELIYAPPGTVLGVDDAGGLVRTVDQGAWIRDDRPRLFRAARIAHAWYGTDRQILELTYRQVSGLFRVGDLITTIGADATLETINTVITYVRLDLLQGRTSIKTQFAELDASLF